MNDEVERGFRVEQHIGTIMQAVILGLLAWSLNTTVTMRTEVGILQAQMQALQATLTSSNGDRYRASDATRDFSAVHRDIARLEDRVNKLENKR